MNKVSQWLRKGADAQEGIQLLRFYAPNARLEQLVRLNPSRYSRLLISALKPFADDGSPDPVQTAEESRRFRDMWPFLSEKDCPMELKILAADKITAYRNYVSAHAELSSCTTPGQCFATARKVINNFTENRKILSEFQYYKEHHSVLGKHPIFKEMQRLMEVRALPISELFRKKRNLENNIWRINDEIKKGDKPHLLAQREARLDTKKRELNEVLRMIDDYENRYGKYTEDNKNRAER